MFGRGWGVEGSISFRWFKIQPQMILGLVEASGIGVSGLTIIVEVTSWRDIDATKC